MTCVQRRRARVGVAHQLLQRRGRHATNCELHPEVMAQPVHQRIIGQRHVRASFIAASPKNLLITDVIEDAAIGGLAAVRFDMRVDPGATGQPGDPCSYTMTGVSPDFAKFITAGAIHRTWWIDDAAAGPLVIIASAAEADTGWFDTRLAAVSDEMTLG